MGSFHIRESEHSGIWVVTYEGEIDLQTRRNALQEGLRLVDSQVVRGIILDFREATIDMTIVDAYFLAGEKHNVPLLRRTKIAVLHQEDEQFHDFFALTGENRGLTIRRFSDIESAYGWFAEM